MEGGRGLLVLLLLRRRRLLGDAAGGLGGAGAGVRLLLTEEGLHVASAAPRHGSGGRSLSCGAGGGVGGEGDRNGSEYGGRGMGNDGGW